MKLPQHSKLIAAVGLSLLAGAAQADYSFQIDSFLVFKNVTGTSIQSLMTNPWIFADDFGNGYVPSDPLDTHLFSNGTAATYSATYNYANLAGTQELNGKLSLSSNDMVDNGFGTLRTNVNLNTNTSDLAADASKGLKSSDTNFFVAGVWDLTNPANNLNGMGSYGVRFNDSINGVTGNDIISLAVQGAKNGQAVVSMLHFDNVTGKSDLLDRQMLDTGHQQIVLGLGYLDTDGNGSKEVGAGYFYLDNGVASGFSYMNATTSIFNGETWTRAAFYAANSSPVLAPVPEPSDYAMMLAGLGMIGYVVRRRQA